MPDKNAGAVAWIATHAPDEDAVTRTLNTMLAEHTRWDSPAELRLHAVDDEGDLAPVLIAAIDPTIPPPSYGHVVRHITAQAIGRLIVEHPGTPPVALCTLQVEGFGVDTGERGELTAEESAAFAARKASELPHAREHLLILAVDIMGRAWSVTKFRGHGRAPDEITTAEAVRHTGPLVDAVRECAALAPVLYPATAGSFWTRKDDDRA